MEWIAVAGITIGLFVVRIFAPSCLAILALIRRRAGFGQSVQRTPRV